jgi:hypothetical protein
MKLTDLFTITKPNRYHKVYKARLVNTSLDATGKTSDAAITGVLAQVQRADRNGNKRTYRFAANGAVFCLYWAFDSWCYDIVNPANQITPSSCHMSVVTYEAALEQMQAHVAQYGI